MILIPFYDIFPKIAKEETHCFHLLQNDENPEAPPIGSYSLVELYCPDQNCDCRKVNIVIVSNEDKKEYVIIQFGWEDQAFYNEHFGFDDHGLPGPSYAPMQFLGQYADFFFEKFEKLCITDKAYVASLKKHYNLIKNEAKNRDLFKESHRQFNIRKTYIKPENILKRNDPCLCGSGKKYKKCCLYQTTQGA